MDDVVDPRRAAQPDPTGWPRTRRWLLVVVLLLVAGTVVIVARARQPERGSGTGGSRGVAPADPPDAPLPGAVSGFGAVCAGRSFPGAATYQGTGPRPMFFAGPFDPSNEAGSVPAAWLTEDVTKIELVVCATRTQGGVASTCDYAAAPTIARTAEVSVPLRYGVYRLVVFEVRTRRQVAEVSLRGEGLVCAEHVAVRPDGSDSPESQLSTLLPYQVTEALTKHIK